jgi:hypothetical protein
VRLTGVSSLLNVARHVAQAGEETHPEDDPEQHRQRPEYEPERAQEVARPRRAQHVERDGAMRSIRRSARRPRAVPRPIRLQLVRYDAGEIASSKLRHRPS